MISLQIKKNKIALNINEEYQIQLIKQYMDVKYNVPDDDKLKFTFDPPTFNDLAISMTLKGLALNLQKKNQILIL